MLKRNVGSVDRCLRLAVGLILVPTGLWLLGGIRGQPLGLVAIVLGLVALTTGLGRFCPLYVPFGMSKTSSRGWAAREMAACSCSQFSEKMRTGCCGTSDPTSASGDQRRA